MADQYVPHVAVKGAVFECSWQGDTLMCSALQPMTPAGRDYTYFVIPRTEVIHVVKTLLRAIDRKDMLVEEPDAE